MASGDLAGHPVAVHDAGGRPAGAVVQDEHDYALWERRVDAMVVLLSQKGRLSVHELRRNIEALGPGAYETMGYYERWVMALAHAMVERGLVSSHELGRRMAEVEARS